MNIDVVKSLMLTILSANNTLQKLAPDWSWKNHIGDFGEFYCINHYGLKKAPANTSGFDAIMADKKTVSIKARSNFNGQVELIGEADLLLVIFIDSKVEVEQVYFGSYRAAMKEGKYNERQNRHVVTLAQLRNLAKSEPQLSA